MRKTNKTIKNSNEAYKHLGKMEVGEEWLVKSMPYTHKTLRTMVSNYGKVSGKKFTVHYCLVMEGAALIKRIS